MKRLFVALCTLALLHLAAPASAVSPASFMCDPTPVPFESILMLIDDINAQNWQGPRCLKACKARVVGCKKANTSMRKCKNAVSKSFWKAEANVCQLLGMAKKTCTAQSKTGLMPELQEWKGLYNTYKGTCDIAYQACKAA